MAGDFVKDINKENLEANINRNEIDDSFDFENFNQQIEKNFQTYLDDNHIKGTTTPETVVKRDFNNRLDKELTKLDEFKDAEIAQKIIIPTTFELQNFQTAIQLEEMQQGIIASENESVDETIITVRGEDLTFRPFNKGSEGPVDRNEVASIFEKNFENKDILLNLLKNAKTNPQDKSSDEIKQFQRIIVGIKDYKNGDKDSDYKNSNSPLGKYGVDGKFGGMTLKAFIDYVQKNPAPSEGNGTTVDGTSVDVDPSAPAGQTGSPDAEVSATGQSTVVDGGVSSSAPTSSSPDSSRAQRSNPETKPGVAPEYLDTGHNIRSMYEGKGGETITIATGLSGYEIVPTVLSDQFNFQEQDGNIVYTLPNENWEGTVSIKVGDKIHTITIKAKESKEGPTQGNDLLSEIDKLDLERRTKENNEIIPQKLKELKVEYNRIKNSTDMDPKEAEKQLRAIEESATKLLRARERNKLEEFLDQARKGQLNGKDSLNNMIIDNAIIYIDGKYLTKEKFLQGVRTKKVDYIKKVGPGKGHKYLDISIPDNFWDSESNDCTITKVIITNDKKILEQNNIGKEEIQYEAFAYTDVEKDGFEGSEKKAIRKIIYGTDKALSIVNAGYKKSTPEKANLNKLKSGLIALINSGLDISEVFNFIADNYRNNFIGDKKNWKNLIESKFDIKNGAQAGNIAKLGELYVSYKNNQDSKAMGDYFTKVMGLLDNYFMRGVDDITTFSGMVDNERIGVAQANLIDSDKQNKAINQLFRGGKDGESLLEGVSFEDTPALRNLKQTIKHIDLPSFFARPGIAQESSTTPELKNKREKNFYDEYRKYSECLRKNEKDSNDKPNMSESEYYNAVFDFLVGIGEARGKIVDAVNSLKLYDGDIADEVFEKSGFSSKEEMKLVGMLCDINSDGKVTFADQGYKMGMEIKNIYKDAMVDHKYGVISKSPMQNLIEFAKKYADKSGSVSTKTDLESITNYEHASLLEQFRKNPSILKYLQNLLASSPANMIDTIFKYGAGSEVATENEVQNELAEISASQEAIEMILNDAKFNEAFDREYKKLVEQGLKDAPEVKARFKPVVAAGMLADIAQTNYYDNKGNLTNTEKSTSWDPKVAVGGVLSTPKAGDFSLMLGVGASVQGGDVDLQSVGLCVGRGDSWKVGRNGNTTISSGLGAGAEFSISNPGQFYPLVSLGFEVSTLVNENQLKKGLRAKPAKYIDVGGSIGLGLSGKDPVPFGEVHVGISRDKIEGIKRTYDNIKQKLGGENGLITKVLNDVNFAQDEVEWKNKIEGGIMENLYPGKKTFNKKEMEEIRGATDNIYRGLVYYMVGTNLRDITDANQKKTVVRKIADNITESYAISRKNEQLQKLDGKINLDKFAIGAIFLAGYYPVPMIGFSFSRYKGLYSSETQASQKEYQRQLRTEGNAKQQGMDQDLGFYDEQNEVMTEKGIEYINQKLQIANGKVQVPKIELLESVDDNGSKKSVSIRLPKDLYKYVNINVDPKLTSYASNDVDGNVIVPANTILTLLTSSKTDTGKFNLIIGDKKAESDDIVIGANNELTGDATAYEGDRGEYILDVNAFNTELESEFGEKADFPIQSCEKTMKISGENFALLKLKDGKSIQDMGGVNSKTRIDNGTIYSPQTGTLTIYQTQGGEYKLYYHSSPSDNLNINYEVEGKETITHTEYNTERRGSVSFNTTESLYGENFMRELDTVLSHMNNSDVHNLLLDWHMNTWKPYVDFMDATCNVKDDGRVDKTDYNEALDKLKIMLSHSKKYQNTYKSLGELEKFINSNSNLTDNQIVMIVDQCKMFFSYEEKLTDGKGDYTNLKNLIKNRGNVYESLSGYVTTGAEFPLKGKDYRSKVVNQLEGRTDLRSDVVGNLVGMTAFYKRAKGTSKQLTEGRGYSMTEMGNTAPLGGVMIPIESTELEATKNWFWNNFDASDIHKNILTNTILNHVKKLISDNASDIDVNAITTDHINKILKGEKSIDIGGKNIKIDIDVNYVFYLLQQCGNESIGIQLSGIKIETGGIEIEEHVNPANPDISQVTTKNTKRKGGFGIYTKTHVASNEQSLAHKGSFGLWLFGGARKTENTVTEPGGGEPPEDPHDNTGSDPGENNNGDITPPNQDDDIVP